MNFLKKPGTIVSLLVIIGLILMVVFTPKQNTNNMQDQNQEQEQAQAQGELIVETVTEGQGQQAEKGDTVSVHYTGTFIDGTKFDSSVDRGVPFEFTLGAGQVIAGWDQGVLGMKVGEKRRLTVPSGMAYGPNDYAGIPGGSTLLFDVELIAIN